MTQAGMILGTAAYMSPEQARGKPVDKRTDIWAFGCVLYEMLAGKRAFDGESVADVLAAVMTREPDLASLPVVTPERVAWVIRRCLEKDPRRRLRDIGDAVAEVEAAPASSSPSPDTTPAATSQTARALPWALAVSGVLFGLATILVGRRDPSPTIPRLVQVEVKTGEDVSLFTDQGTAVVLSPDGSSLAFTGRKVGQIRQLYLRRLDQLEAVQLAGTEDALSAFFSPDGQWIAFFAGGKLKKVPVSGGPVVVLCDAPSGRGGSWGDDGWIVFTPNASGNTPLQRVSANGGAPERLTTLREGEATQRWPQVLPGGRGVIYSTTPTLGSYNDGEIVVQPLPGGDQKVVLKGGFFGRYLRSGHLTYVHDGRLFAVPFDLQRLETVGSPVPILERVSRTVVNGVAQFDVSATGTAAYIAIEAGLTQPLQWLTRDGGIALIESCPVGLEQPAAVTGWSSAGGRYLRRTADRHLDLRLGSRCADRLTFDPGEDWIPSGRQMAGVSCSARTVVSLRLTCTGNVPTAVGSPIH